MSSVAIVQARMGSTRLPGKVLKPIGKYPALYHTLTRTRASGTFTVLAIPDTAENDVLAAEGTSWGFPVVRGSEGDVLSRYYDAASVYGASEVTRITGDCPFVDPLVVSRVQALFRFGVLPYASNVYPTRTFPTGLDVEVFDMRGLRVAMYWTTDMDARGHVGSAVRPWCVVPPGCLENYPYGDCSHFRWTLDTPEDLLFFQAVAARIDCEPPHPTTAELLALLEREPELAKINT